MKSTHEIYYDCRSEEERSNEDTSEDLFCKSYLTNMIEYGYNHKEIGKKNYYSPCKKHEIKIGNSFKYNLHDSNITNSKYGSNRIINIKILRIAKVEWSRDIVDIVKVETDCDFSDIKSIRYYTQFDNIDTPSVKKVGDKWEIVFQFNENSICRGNEIKNQNLIDIIKGNFIEEDYNSEWETDSETSSYRDMIKRAPSLD